MTLADAGQAHQPDLALVRPMTHEDVAWASALHESALPHGFFARLGTRFLTAYYETFIDSPYALALVAEAPAGPAGVLVGTLRNRSHYSWVMDHCARHLAGRALASLMVRPRTLGFFLRTRLAWYLGTGLRAARKAKHALTWSTASADAAVSAPRTRQPAVLTHVAVEPAARGAGAGAALVTAFTSAARDAGCNEAVLVTLSGPAGAGPFYRRLGWKLRDLHHDHDGRLLECYYRRL